MVTSGIGDAKPLSITLNTGAQMPAVGLGTWQADPGVIGNVVKAAIQTGYRHIDCATAYRNQKEIGDALQELFKSGEIKREDLFITSKLWVTELDPNEVPHAVARVLEDLQLDYIDLYLIHWPVGLVKDAKDPLQPEHITTWDVEATWRALEKLVQAGKVRAIGVSNFSKKKLQEVLSCAKIPPAVNQVECHPMWQQRELRSFCESKQIHLSAYASMGSAGSRYATVSVLSHPILTEVAQNLGKTPAQVALRWGLQMGQSVLPKTVKLERLAQNLDVLSWSIPDDDMDKISTIEQRRFFTVPFSVDHDSINSLWDE